MTAYSDTLISLPGRAVYWPKIRRTLGGWAKAGWILLVILLPLIGVLAYVVVHGDRIQDRREREVLARDAAFRAGGTTSSEFELARLADLHNRGVITDAEFEQRQENIQP